MNRKILVFALLLLLVTTLIPTTISMFLTTSAAPSDTGWTLVTDARAMKPYPDLREYVWQKVPSMPPNGQYDRIGLHRLVKTGVQTRGVIFFDAGYGELFMSNPSTDSFTKDENFSAPIYWANRGFDVYALDRRSYFLQNLTVSEMQAYMKDYGYDQWISDSKEGVNKAKEVSGAQKIFYAGSQGGALVVVNYATKYWKEDLLGIVLIDPVLGAGSAARGAPLLKKIGNVTNTYNLTKAISDMITSGSAAQDLLSSQPRWQYILANPGAPAEYPPGTPLTPTINPATNKTWANITEWCAYSTTTGSSPPGANSNLLGGYGNITDLVMYFASINRYAPTKVLVLEPTAWADWVNCPYLTYDFDDHWNEIGVPMISFVSGLYANNTGTFSFVNGINNTDFTGKIFPNYGRYDLMFGQSAAKDVFAPAYDWMVNHLPPDLTLFGNKAVGTVYDQNDANAQSVSYFTCTKSAVVTDIMAYISGASAGNCIAALYAVNGGSAGALLAQSKAVSIGTTFSWVDLQLPTPYTVTAGTTYGLAIMGNVPVNVMEVAGTGQRDHNAVSSYAKGFANPFGPIWGTDNRGAMSIYAASSNQLIGTEYVYGEGGYVVLNLPQGALYNKTDLRIGFMNVEERSTKGAECTLDVRIWVPSTSKYGAIAFIDNNLVAVTSLKKMYAGVTTITFVLVNKDDLKISKEGDYTIVNLTRPVDIQFGSPAAQIYKDLNFTLPPLTLRFMQSGEIFDRSTSNSTYPSGWTSTTTTWTAPGWANVQITSWGCQMPTAAIIQPKIDIVATPPTPP